MFKNFGPSILISAAFIGPGTITVCLLSGINYSYQLVWVMLFAIVCTIVLQEMAARLGLVTGSGLAESVHKLIEVNWIKYSVFTLIFLGILIGNTAYESGNISGTYVGLQMMIGSSLPKYVLNLFIVIPAIILLYLGSYKVIQAFFTIIVGVMSLSFLISAIITRPDLGMILAGIKPSLPNDNLLILLGLIGTTVVPYNLFLHAAIVNNKWKGVGDLKFAKNDTIFGISMGGLVSICILITGASLAGYDIKSMEQFSMPFEQVYGSFGRILFGVGIFAAGFTSTITAPLAASLVAKGLFKWDDQKDISKIRFVWMSVLIIGYLVASSNYKPIEIIQLAQYANGLLLPLIAIFLLWAVNKKVLMGQYTNSIVQNTLAIISILVVIALGLKSLSVFS